MKPVMKYMKKRSQQQGAALVVGLIMLLLLTLIGVAGMRDTLLQQKMVANAKDREVALQAAEAALLAAENSISSASAPGLSMTGPGLYDLAKSSDKSMLDSQRASSSSEAAFWQNWAWTSSASIAYNFALNGVASGNPPRYVIEKLNTGNMGSANPPGGGGGSGGGNIFECQSLSGCLDPVLAPGSKTDYRITARAVGSTANAVVILQSTMRRFEPAGP
ncbi:MAG TPA: pilus assembly protein [Pseudomonadales bacterium]|nr:pilus assembly protein [Pseudomonadales bacterium]HRG49691.1 pilus assembly protein [Pseudomonadales bacterium]